MIDIESMIKAIKNVWVKHLVYKTNNFTILAKQNSKIKDFEFFFKHKISREINLILFMNKLLHFGMNTIHQQHFP